MPVRRGPHTKRLPDDPGSRCRLRTFAHAARQDLKLMPVRNTSISLSAFYQNFPHGKINPLVDQVTRVGIFFKTFVICLVKYCCPGKNRFVVVDK
jgi:hypothetical protein